MAKAKTKLEGFDSAPNVIEQGDFIIVGGLGKEEIMIVIRNYKDNLLYLHCLEDYFNIWSLQGGFKSGSKIEEVESFNRIKINKVIKRSTYDLIIRKQEV